MSQKPALVTAYVEADVALDRAAAGSDTEAFTTAERQWALATLAYCRDITNGGMAPYRLRAQAEAVLQRLPNRVSAFIDGLSEKSPPVPGRVVAWQSDHDDAGQVLQLVWSLPPPDGPTWSSELTDRLVRLASSALADESRSVYVKFVADNELDRLNQSYWSSAA